MFARYLLSMPFLQAATGLLIPLSRPADPVREGADASSRSSPSSRSRRPSSPSPSRPPGSASSAASTAQKVRCRDYVRLVLGTFPYQVFLAAGRRPLGLPRAAAATRWEKTEHTGAHRRRRGRRRTRRRRRLPPAPRASPPLRRRPDDHDPRTPARPGRSRSTSSDRLARRRRATAQRGPASALGWRSRLADPRLAPARARDRRRRQRDQPRRIAAAHRRRGHLHRPGLGRLQPRRARPLHLLVRPPAARLAADRGLHGADRRVRPLRHRRASRHARPCSSRRSSRSCCCGSSPAASARRATPQPSPRSLFAALAAGRAVPPHRLPRQRRGALAARRLLPRDEPRATARSASRGRRRVRDRRAEQGDLPARAAVPGLVMWPRRGRETRRYTLSVAASLLVAHRRQLRRSSPPSRASSFPAPAGSASSTASSSSSASREGSGSLSRPREPVRATLGMWWQLDPVLHRRRLGGRRRRALRLVACVHSAMTVLALDRLHVPAGRVPAGALRHHAAAVRGDPRRRRRTGRRRGLRAADRRGRCAAPPSAGRASRPDSSSRVLAAPSRCGPAQLRGFLLADLDQPLRDAAAAGSQTNVPTRLPDDRRRRDVGRSRRRAASTATTSSGTTRSTPTPPSRPVAQRLARLRLRRHHRLDAHLPDGFPR